MASGRPPNTWDSLQSGFQPQFGFHGRRRRRCHSWRRRGKVATSCDPPVLGLPLTATTEFPFGDCRPVMVARERDPPDSTSCRTKDVPGINYMGNLLLLRPPCLRVSTCSVLTGRRRRFRRSWRRRGKVATSCDPPVFGVTPNRHNRIPVWGLSPGYGRAGTRPSRFHFVSHEGRPRD